MNTKIQSVKGGTSISLDDGKLVINQQVYQFAGNPDGESLDIYIYDTIGSGMWFEDDEDITQKNIKEVLDEYEGIKQINLYVNSNGGDVYEANGIYALLKRHPANVTAYVDGWAASAASFILLAADEIIMAPSSMQMLHDMWTFAIGNSRDFLKVATDLERMEAANHRAYLERAGDKLTADQLNEIMKNETWLTAEECLELGLCDKVQEIQKQERSLQERSKPPDDNIEVNAVGLVETISADQITTVTVGQEAPTNKAAETAAIFMAAIREAAERK
jgi:ATP-dependent protease ClpP protease subunit